MRKLIFLLLAVSASLGYSQQVDTPASDLARKLIETVNSTNKAAIAEFVSNHLSSDASSRMNADKCSLMLRNLRAQSGDLELGRVLMATEREFRGFISSAKAGKKVALELVLSKKDQGRAKWIWLHHLPSGKPVSLPKEKLDEAGRVKAIESFLDANAEAGMHSGAVLIARENDVLLHKAWGFAHSTSGKHNLTNMLYPTASVGKMFTAVAIAQLEQAGKLKYTDVIGAHLPDYPNKEAAEKVQIQHLLAHTGGLGDPFDSPKLSGRKREFQAYYFETFAEKPLAFAPGARHEYSNGGYIVLAAIVEKLSGLTFAEYLEKNVFGPAGMKNTGITATSTSLPVSVPHSINVINDPLGLQGPQPKADSREPKNASGMGGWTSTASDLFKFARALREEMLLNHKNTLEVTSGKIAAFPQRKDIQYCFGFYEMPMGSDRLIGHSGGGDDSGIGAEVEMLWDNQYTIIILSNQSVEEARFVTHSIAKFLEKQSRL